MFGGKVKNDAMGGIAKSAMIAYTCCAVKVARTSGRAASANRPATLVPGVSGPPTAAATLGPWNGRYRARRAVGRTAAPRPANKMIRARTASCCGQVCCRTSDSKCRRSRSVTRTAAARNKGIAKSRHSSLKAAGYNVFLGHGIRISIGGYQVLLRSNQARRVELRGRS
jgi:hypothetical protein